MSDCATGVKPIHHLTSLVHELLAKRIMPGDAVMDGTAGNGFDSEFLWNCVKPGGQLYVFDVQSEAIDKTKDRLIMNGWNENDHMTVQMHCASHGEAEKVIREPLQAVMFNLGYLPGSDKKIITEWTEMKRCLDFVTSKGLKNGGIISIISYGGHPGGEREQYHLLEYAENMSSPTWNATVIRTCGTIKKAPVLIMIEKKM